MACVYERQTDRLTDWLWVLPGMCGDERTTWEAGFLLPLWGQGYNSDHQANSPSIFIHRAISLIPAQNVLHIGSCHLKRESCFFPIQPFVYFSCLNKMIGTTCTALCRTGKVDALVMVLTLRAKNFQSLWFIRFDDVSSPLLLAY